MLRLVSPHRFRWIAKEDLQGRIDSCVTDVLGVFAQIEVQSERTPVHPETMGHSIAATVEFAGTYHGFLAIQCPETLALRIASGMRSSAISDRDQMCDALGELASIVGGDVKLFLSPGGRDISLSLPEVQAGTPRYSLDFDHPAILQCCFSCSGLPLQVTVTVHKESPTESALCSPFPLSRTPVQSPND